jgi:peptide chain release factor 1
MQWIAKLEEIEERYNELSTEMAEPGVVADQKRYQKIAKQHSDISEVVEKFREWKSVEEQLGETKLMLEDSDPDMAAMAQDEVASLETRQAELSENMRVLLLPKDPNDEKGIVLEVRAGTGGDEASLFAAEVFRMYCRYAEAQRWKVEITSQSDSEVGGLKEVIALVTGKRVYSRLKYESGVHRVQRVPTTETQGRVHTSAITVAVMPQADEVDVEVQESDLRVDTYCSSGPGGQSVNTTYSAVRITHEPTGLVVTCQDEKSQIKNRKKAMQVLRSRLYEVELEKVQSEQADQRRSMVRTGDRSEKIRTYNFPEMRITDHRVGLKIHQLPAVLAGEMDALLGPLTTYFQTEQMGMHAD